MRSRRPRPSEIRPANPTAGLSLGVILLGASCGSGGGGSESSPLDTSQILPTIGLTSVVAGDASAGAGDGVIQARWDARELDGSPVSVGLFLSTDEATVYQGAPVHTAATAGSTVLTGLAEDQRCWLGIAVDLGAGEYAPVGAVMGATPGTIVFVDAASVAVSPDGTTPATAFPALAEGALAASGLGAAGLAANVWVAGGTYAGVSVPLDAGVHVYGGFDPTFDLAARNPHQAANRTILRAQPGQAVIEIAGSDAGAVLDGLQINGQGASFGVDLDSSSARLSAVDIQDCTGRGIRLRSLSTTKSYRVTVARCTVLRSGDEGLSLQGAFRLDVEDSRFSSNGLEGLDCDALVAPDGVTAGLSVRDSTFFGNGEEGLDCTLGAPPVAGGSSSYAVEIVGSRFERNGWKPSGTPTGGLKIDIEFEGFPGWSADLVVRGCLARANRGIGVHLDLDSSSTTFVHRLLSTANGADGLLIASESAPSLATVSSSVLMGNKGAGVRVGGAPTGGNVPVVLAHSVVAGNAGGGLRSELVESAAVSSIGWLQGDAWSGAGGVRERGVVLGLDPLTPVFATAPVDFRTVIAFNGSSLELDDASNLAIGDSIEVADDGTRRLISGFSGGSRVFVDATPTSLDVPALFVRFEAGAPVGEDWQLAPGSIALAAGMPPPAGPAPDAGVFGAPLGGVPGSEDVVPAVLFRAAATTPPTTTALAQGDDIAVTFAGGTLDSLTIPGNVQVRDGAGQAIAIPAPTLQNDELVLQAPGGGWPVGALTVELFAGLATIDAPPAGLATPVALPFEVQ